MNKKRKLNISEPPPGVFIPISLLLMVFISG